MRKAVSRIHTGDQVHLNGTDYEVISIGQSSERGKVSLVLTPLGTDFQRTAEHLIRWTCYDRINVTLPRDRRLTVRDV